VHLSHPLTDLPKGVRWRLFWPLAALSVVMLLIFQAIDVALTSPVAPLGIVSFELAGSVSAVQEILASWDAQAQLHAAFGLGLDYLFMPIYSTAIGLGCIWAAEIVHRSGWPLAGLGAALAWGLWLAALFDATENLALTAIMFGAVAAPWPQVSAFCASIKFTLIAAGLIFAIYGLAGGIAEAVRGRRKKRENG
jgi:hypothetical protein